MQETILDSTKSGVAIARYAASATLPSASDQLCEPSKPLVQSDATQDTDRHATKRPAELLKEVSALFKDTARDVKGQVARNGKDALKGVSNAISAARSSASKIISSTLRTDVVGACYFVNEPTY